MATLFSEIAFQGLPDQIEAYESHGNRLGSRVKGLFDLGDVNLFVGKNHSGKSRLLRALFSAQDYHCNMPGIVASDLTSVLTPVQQTLASALRGPITGYAGVSPAYLDAHLPGHFFLESKAGSQTAGARQALEKLIGLAGKRVNYEANSGGASDAHLFATQRTIAAAAEKALELLPKHEPPSGPKDRVYIPILRGLRPLAGGDVYTERTNRDYKLEPMTGRSIVTGLDFYQRLLELTTGSPEEREAKKEYERFLSVEFFERTPIELTPSRGSDVVSIRAGSNRKDFAVFDQGDGLQALIVLTFRAFTTPNETFFFVEEPEQHLHPGLQRRLLDLYGTVGQLARHQYFLSTHSNHMLDMVSENTRWSTYVLRQRGTRAIDVLPIVGKEKIALRELGARSSSVFLTNATIWVEGVTDRLYIRTLLKRYLTEHQQKIPIMEDTHYSFAEYAGANVTHWEFSDSEPLGEGIRAARICSESMLLADGDILEKGDRAKKLREQLGDRFLVLHCKEIENVLPEAVVRAVARLRVHDEAALAKIRQSEYSAPNRPLGSYLDETLGTSSFAAASGTVRGKSAFCADAIKAMGDTEWPLDGEALRICEAIVHFVNTANELEQGEFRVAPPLGA